MADRFQEPGWFTRHVFNPLVAGLTRLGLPLAGSRVLEVKGRKSGEWRKTPVNPLDFDGERYLVAPRGHAQWVRNMRAVGGGRLVVGRRTEEFSATEVADAEKARRAARLPEEVEMGGRRLLRRGRARTPPTRSCCGSRPTIRSSASRAEPAPPVAGPSE